MKLLSFVIFVTYFVVTHIECDLKSNYGEQRTKLIDNVLSNLVNKTNNSTFLKNFVPPPFLGNFSEENHLGLNISLEDALLSDEQRGKICLKNVTRCIEKDDDYRTTTDRLSNIMFASLPPFDLSNVKGVSKACQKDSKQYVEDLKKFKLWALRMYDSTAKLPSGMLNGNVNRLGDFDMCLGANLESGKVSGQYCLASIELQTPHSSYLAGLHRLLHAHYHFKSKLEDPGHRVPRFSSINWALCVPSTCTPRDVRVGLKHVLGNIIEGTELEIRYEVKPEMCQTAQKKHMPLSTIIAISFFGTIIIVELLATVYDAYADGEKNKWITAFSFRKNWGSMTTMKRSPGDLEAVHGIRMLNAVFLLLGHKSMALFFLPYSNRTECIEYVARPFSVLGRAASLYTDPFIMISGTLTAYSLLGKLNKSAKINIFQEYLSRLFRIVPTFAALIAFCTFILPWLGNGPMWNLVVTHHSDICKQYWWRNLLFIHNYFGFKDMCLTHTHHVGIDTQLFFTSPFLIYMLWRWPKKGSIVLITIATISTIMRYYITYTMRLSNYIHFGTSIQQLFDTADNMYILPVYRATVYIMGIFLGYVLRNYKNISLTKIQLRVGNCIALFSSLISFLGPSFMSTMDYVYDPTDAAWYASVSPILWVGAFAWVIFTSQLGYKGTVGRFFSKPIWVLWTKISYTVYLTQFPIFFYNVGVTRSTQEYGFFRLMFNLQEFAWVIGLSMALSLAFEFPFQNLRDILIKDKQRNVGNGEVIDKKKL